MADRYVELEKSSLNDPDTIKQLTEVVIGYVKRERAITDLVTMDMASDLFDSLADMDPEFYSQQKIRISADGVQKRAAGEAVNLFAEYCEQLRDSLKNVQIDIEQRETQDRLFTSDDFWRSFISKAAKPPKTEQKHWDFKKTLDMWHIKNDPEKSEKAHEFAERVAGFANNLGGVLLVGITDSPPRQIVGLGINSRDIENYMKYTRKVIGDYIEHNADFVHFQQVNIPDAVGEMKLCLVIAIQKTYTVLAVKGVDGRSYSYPFREETGLVWKDQNSIHNHKAGLKSDKFDFLGVLQQFVNEKV